MEGSRAYYSWGLTRIQALNVYRATAVDLTLLFASPRLGKNAIPTYLSCVYDVRIEASLIASRF